MLEIWQPAEMLHKLRPDETEDAIESIIFTAVAQQREKSVASQKLVRLESFVEDILQKEVEDVQVHALHEHQVLFVLLR